jgi:uncharacterized protein YukE
MKIKTENSIKWDFTQATKIADNLEELAGEIIKKKGTLEEKNSNLSKCWISENEKLFISKVNSVETDLDKISNYLKNAAKNIRAMANNTYQTEKQALEIAKKRNYS